MRKIYGAAFAAAVFGTMCGQMASAATYIATIDTTTYSGQQIALGFDLTGNGPVPPSQTNTVSITNLKIDGAAVGASPTANTGGVTGDLPGTVVIDDASNLFNEFLPTVTLGNQLSFTFTTTELFGGVAPANFSFLFVDPSTNFPLFGTSDPTTLDYLFRVTIYGAGYVLDKSDCATLNSPANTCLNVFSANNGEVSADVEQTPLPAALPLFVSGLGAIGALGLRRRRKAA